MENERRQKIMVFQQNNSGKLKIDGLRKHAADEFDLQVIDIEEVLPDVLDDTSGYLPKDLSCDLVLDYLKHNDLSTDLARLCQQQNILYVGSGKKIPGQGAITPPTCCGLAKLDGLGRYGERFGVPEFEVELEGALIKDVTVVRGAPCGATWDAAKRLIGTSVDDAVRKIGLETQFYCYADTAGWDPIYGKSPVHFAGKVHAKQLEKALRIAALQTTDNE